MLGNWEGVSWTVCVWLIWYQVEQPGLKDPVSTQFLHWGVWCSVFFGLCLSLSIWHFMIQVSPCGLGFSQRGDPTVTLVTWWLFSKRLEVKAVRSVKCYAQNWSKQSQVPTPNQIQADEEINSTSWRGSRVERSHCRRAFELGGVFCHHLWKIPCATSWWFT